jgi:diguanylate cyclase (GGDEF)-like protein
LPRVIACITEQHDLRLVLLAAIICLAATATTFAVLPMAASARGARRNVWLLMAGAAAGAGTWTTHFLGMLAYDPGLPTAYDPVLTMASLLIAVGLMTAGLAIGTSGRRGLDLAGGACVGIAIAGMHFTGMHALAVPGVLVWHYDMVAASLAVGLGLSCAAMAAFCRLGRHHNGRLAAALLAAGIVGLHFIATAAVTLQPDPQVEFQPSRLQPEWLSITIAVAAIIVLTMVLAAMLLERRTQREAFAALAASKDLLRRQNGRFDAALKNMVQGLALYDREQRLIVSNERYASMYGLAPEQIRPGIELREVLQLRAANGVYEGATPAEYVARRMCKPEAKSQCSCKLKLNDGRSMSLVCTPMPDGGFLVTHEDITERQAAEARIAHMARYDSLTDVPNRLMLGERLQECLPGVRRGGTLAVHCLDLDRFKEVNDELGHRLGDALLVAVAERLRASIRHSDMVARVGGDEFVVVQQPAPDPSAAAALAARLIDEIGKPFTLGEQRIEIGASIGIAMAPGDGETAEALMRQADLALYRAKCSERGTYRFFEPGMNEAMLLRRDVERNLRKAMQQNELELHFQPLMNLETSRMTGCEALVRWRHPERGMIPPNVFIPIAEETGLIHALGEWILLAACREACNWPGGMSVAVNVSPVQFRSRNIAEMVERALAETGLAPRRLEIEVTESLLIQDSDSTRANLLRLKELGVRIALDDFGTGYSSLSYLRSFPFDKIKIDRSFITDMVASGPSALAIVRAVTQLARSLDMTTTAEGIETEEQLAMVRAEGCTEAQGYLLGKPMRAADVRQVLAPCPAAAVAAA